MQRVSCHPTHTGYHGFPHSVLSQLSNSTVIHLQTACNFGKWIEWRLCRHLSPSGLLKVTNTVQQLEVKTEKMTTCYLHANNVSLVYFIRARFQYVDGDNGKKHECWGGFDRLCWYMYFRCLRKRIVLAEKPVPMVRKWSTKLIASTYS